MKRFSFLSKMLFVFYCSLLIGHCSLAQDTTITYMLDPGGHIREHNADFTKMLLDVKFNTKEGKVIGNVKYDFRPIQFVMDTLFLNAPGIDIKKVLLNDKEVAFSTDSEGVTIKFLQPMDWNKQYRLEISYEATPRKGLYFVGWNVQGANAEHDRYFTRKQIWTQGQLIDNRNWIPCYDDVNDKMLIETTTTFDTAYTVISNGVLKDKKKNADGTYTWHYAMNHPMVPYLLMLGIDKYAYRDYKSRNGVVSRQYYYSDRLETVGPTYEYSAEMMDWLPNELGVKYPWPAYANIPVQDFMYGAMENTTATVYGDFFLCDKTMAFERTYTAVNAHELTHQWFGDYITEYSSQHHWLHESFATYYSKQYMRHLMGEDFYQWNKRGEANASIGADKMDRYPIGHSKGGSSRVYPKGSFVIDMIRYVVGDSVFKRSVTNYLKNHAYSNVTNHDFMFTFMETAGVNLDWFFDQWIYRAGYPNYEVSYDRQKDAVMFYVKQTQKTDELTGYFKMPVVFEVHFKDGSSSIKKVWLSHAADTVYVTAPNGKELDYTLFDPASNILKTTDFKKSFEELSAQAEKAKNFIDRYDAVNALKDTPLEKKRDLLVKLFSKESYNIIKDEIIVQLYKDWNPVKINLYRQAMKDKDFIVRRTAVDNLDSIPTVLLPDIEKLLSDTSFITIENTLRKLCKLYPEKTMDYLNRVKELKGVNNNVRIAYDELLEAQHPRGGGHLLELVDYTSDKYEFRTRSKAIEAIERLNLCTNDVIKNLFNASLYTNSRLSGPAIKTLKALIKKPENMQLAKDVFAKGHWKGWESKIIEDALKQ